MLYDTFKGFIEKHPRFFLINCILMLLVPINEVFISRLYGRLFDAIQKNTFTMNHFYVILATMMLLQIGFAYNDYFNSKQMTEFQQYCKKRFLNTVFEKFERNKIEPNASDVIGKILRTQHLLADWYSKIFSWLVPITLQLLITIVYLMTIDVKLGVYLSVLIGVFITFIVNSTNLCNDNNVVMDEQLAKLHDDMGDIVVNYLSVYKEQSLNSEVNILDHDFKKYQKYHNETIKCTIKYRLLLTTIIMVFLVMFVKRCYNILKMNRIQNAVFYSVFMILANLISNMVYMIDMHRDMIFDWGLIKNSGFDKIEKSPVINYDCREQPYDPSVVLEIRDIRYKYPNKTHYTIDKLNLKVKQGERLAITGHIGSGKSTLIKIILRLIYPESGNIILKQKCIYDMSVKEYFNLVGFMPQNCLLFKRSIMDNIKYDNRNITDKYIIDTITKYKLMKHFKNGLDIGTDSLSGGQRQLVWFLRIYFKNPEIIILDEPTASLDKETKDLFIYLMNTLLKDKTIIIITHDSYMLEHVSRTEDVKLLQEDAGAGNTALKAK